MTATVLLLAAAYTTVLAFLAVILLSSSIALPARAVATILSVALMYTTYLGIGELRGWPSPSILPRTFHLLSARIVEPNPIIEEAGRIYLWVEELDENNYPSGRPRAYQLPYTPNLAETVGQAMGQISDGEEIFGTVQEQPPVPDTAERLAEEIEGADQSTDELGTLGQPYVPLNPGDLSFGPLPAPTTPEKGP